MSPKKKSSIKKFNVGSFLDARCSTIQIQLMKHLHWQQVINLFLF